MNNYKLESPGSLFYCTSVYGHWAEEDTNLVILNSPGLRYVNVTPIEFFGEEDDIIISFSVGITHLKFIKAGFSKEDTKIEYRKADGRVRTHFGKIEIAFEDLYVDGRKIAIHYLVGDNKVWDCVI